MTQTFSKKVLIFGNGPMAKEYAKVYREGMNRQFGVCGINLDHVSKFVNEEGATEGLLFQRITSQDLARYDYFAVVSSVFSLEEVTTRILGLGGRKLLVEKPAALSVKGSEQLEALAKEQDAFIRVAVNRRFYTSVQGLLERLKTERPVCGSFDFTDRRFQLEQLHRESIVKERWGLSNSIHVFDTLRYLFGDASALQGVADGKDILNWHPISSRYVGSLRLGQTPFSYSTSWACPGRWNIEVMTEKARYKLSPFEKLQAMEHSSFSWTEIGLDYSADLKFKPGLLKMIEAFEDAAGITNNSSNLTSVLPGLGENTKNIRLISQVMGYPF